MESGRARVHKRYPFTIRLVDRTMEESVVQEAELRIDPGSRTTGFAIVRKDGKDEDHVLHLSQLKHRGQQIHLDLKQRSAIRRGRRSRKTWYRAPRFDNRTKPEGWIPPSLLHRVQTTETWVRRYMSLAPLSSIAFEYTNFDMQLMQNPDISGVEYQKGTLQGYEVRQYLYEKFGHRCVYCDAEPKIIEIDHVMPQSKGGSDRVSNLVPSCHECNQKKSNSQIEEFLKDDPERLMRIRNQIKAPLRDATAMNVVRPAILRNLDVTGLLVTCWSGARTKWNRDRLGIPKEHHLDAACVGDIKAVYGWDGQEVLIEDGVAKMPDRTCFAGSVATTDRLVRTMHFIGGASLPDAVKMLTSNPATLMGYGDTKGKIRPGYDADIVICDKKLYAQQTYSKGHRIF